MSDTYGKPPPARAIAGTIISETPAQAPLPATGSRRLIRGRYQLIAELGEGGMGITYRAWDTQVGVPVVVKLPRREVRHDAGTMNRFSREIEAMRAVPHKHIVPIIDSGDDEGCPFVVMRFLPGGSLSDYRRLNDAGNAIKNPPGMLHFWLPGVASAIDWIHARGLLHRDVKPGNIFLDGFLTPFLGDFGIAKVVDESGGLAKDHTLTSTRMVVGTPEYMAPELFAPRAPLNGRVDQYALAVTVYEMLAGEKPFKGSLAHIIVEHSSLPAPPLEKACRGLPQTACQAVERALSKNPAERFATCAEFAAAVLVDLRPLEREADTVRLLCPKCKNILRLPVKAAGRTGRCPQCQSLMNVAADLGSLWLEAEKQTNVEAQGGQPAAGTDQPTPGFVATSQPLRLGLRTWIRVALAACLGLVVGYASGPRIQQPLPEGQTKEMQAAVAAIAAARDAEATLRGELDALLAHRVTLQNERDGLAADNRRLVADLDAVNQAKDEAMRDNVELAKRLERMDAESQKAAVETAESATPLHLERMINSIGIELVRIPKGEFMMGIAATKDYRGTGDPRKKVTIPEDFWLGRTEVTNAQWKRVMGNVPSNWKDDGRPVELVSWNDAVEFCRKLSAIPEERAMGRAYRLPTEAEWEYACRAGTTTRYSFGDGDRFHDHAWFQGNSGQQTHPVLQRKPNLWGLHDMHGNVEEWCSDFDPIQRAPDVRSSSNPSIRGARGGSWQGHSALDTGFDRSREPAASTRSDLGFRLALSISGASSPELNPATVGGGAKSKKLELPSLTNSIGVALVRIPHGEFIMGSPLTEKTRELDENQQKVTILQGFWLGRTEVTNAQWRRVMGTVPSKWKDENRPVEMVSWKDAIEFCQRLAAMPEERALGRVYRLPMEAEWEYACRGGTTTMYSFGEDETLLDGYAWLESNSGQQTHPVAQKKPNPWGLYDMHGNVEEFCGDLSGRLPRSPVIRPFGDTLRVFRGGSLSSPGAGLRSARRSMTTPAAGSQYVGFRLALTHSGAEPPEVGEGGGLVAGSAPDKDSVPDPDGAQSESAQAASGKVPRDMADFIVGTWRTPDHWTLQFKADGTGTCHKPNGGLHATSTWKLGIADHVIVRLSNGSTMLVVGKVDSLQVRESDYMGKLIGETTYRREE